MSDPNNKRSGCDDNRKVHENNAVWWNETAEWYAERGADIDIELLRSGGSTLFDSERELLGDLHSWCRRAIHLQCSHGTDALSLLNLGAAEVVGIDISDRLIQVASRKAQALGSNATWVCADVLDAPHDLDGTADLVYTGRSAICWMMDISAWARVVARLLKPNALFFIHEGHPLDWVWDTQAAGYTLDSAHGDYFCQSCRESLFVAPTKASPRYRQWTLSDTINSLIDAGLAIERLMEYPQPFWAQFPNMADDTARKLPHSFALLARKR